uniref:Uncharacterized protein n=1 Tax=Scleropages formosus TaxID=113540 RepID=A0A8C9TTM8_SCLFO
LDGSWGYDRTSSSPWVQAGRRRRWLPNSFLLSIALFCILFILFYLFNLLGLRAVDPSEIIFMSVCKGPLTLATVC